MARQKKAAPGGNRRGVDVRSRRDKSTRKRQHETAVNQRARLLAYLSRHGTVSTLEARGGELSIMHPGGRVYELRKAGVDILTILDERQGCGRYVLRRGGHAID